MNAAQFHVVVVVVFLLFFFFNGIFAFLLWLPKHDAHSNAVWEKVSVDRRFVAQSEKTSCH